MQIVGESSTQDKNILEDITVDQNSEKNNLFDNIGSSTEVPVEKVPDGVVEKAELPGVIRHSYSDKAKINGELYSKEDLVITAAEKSGFINSMITGERYIQEYSIFGGKINVKIRSRTNKETQAMYSYMRHVLDDNRSNVISLESDMPYILLVSQIEEINGVKFPEMKAPYCYTSSAGKVEDPGWFEDLKAWKDKPEGLTNALINRVQLFEYKYWTMVTEASNKNFWNSDTSIEG